MLVRIRLSAGPKVSQKRRKNRHVALAMASLLTPAAVMAFVLGLWRLVSDLKVTNEFPITDGLFSHWQVWITMAAMLQFCALFLNRYGNSQVVIQKTGEKPRRTLVNSEF
jgi:hypothetical protein